MRSYGQPYCPIARASELFAERWTPIIVRNLLLGCATFGEIIEGAPGIPRSLLSQRLRDLERQGVVSTERSPQGRGQRYRLTPAGRELSSVCHALGTWGARWLEAAPALDPGVVLWAVAKCMDRTQLPARRVVVRFDLPGYPKFWLLVQRPEPELCRKSPGLAEDLVVRTDAATLTAWHMGRSSWSALLDAGTLRVEGPARLARAFRSWGGQSPFATVAAATRRHADALR